MRSGRLTLTWLDGVICSYLMLPLLLFCAWFRWPVALALAMLAAYGFVRMLSGVQWTRVEIGRQALVLTATVALAWTALAGIGHFFFANLDWTVRDAVLRDLAATPWPPMYDTDGAAPRILRAPVGFYLPAAAAGGLLGLPAADLLLYLWTALGFALVLCAAATLFRSGRERLLCCALMLLFGGLDVIGFWMGQGTLPGPGEHTEWWASFVQYSSSSTLLFWVPNHALPAWLGLLLALHHWRKPELARMAPMLAAAVPLWSPFAALGLLPFFIAGLNWRRDHTTLLSLRSSWPFIVLALLVTAYLTMDTQDIVKGWVVTEFRDRSEFWLRYTTFCMLEFGIAALLLISLGTFELRLAIAMVVLSALPLYRIGIGNDLAMRASIPALTVLALATVQPMLAASSPALPRALLGCVLAVGALGALQEPMRALLTPRWAATGQTLAQVSLQENAPFDYKGLPSGYVGRLNRSVLQPLLRPPHMVLPDPHP